MESKLRTNIAYIIPAILITAGLLFGVFGQNESAEDSAINSLGVSKSSRTPSVDLEFSLRDLYENEVTIAEFDGQVRVVNFWATWCPPCRDEIPAFQSFHENYGHLGVKIIGIALDVEGAEIVKPFVEKMNMTYLTLIDTGRESKWGPSLAAAKFGGIKAIPTTFFIDRSGKVQKKHLGKMSYGDLEAAVLPLLEQ